MFQKILIVGLALAVSAVAVFVVVRGSPSSAHEPAPIRHRNIELVEPEGVPDRRSDAHGRVVLFEYHDFEGVDMQLSVYRLTWNCRGPLFEGRQNRFYTVYIETPSLERFRVFNFGGECNLGTFHSIFVTLPEGIPHDPLFNEPITVDIVIEADDGLELNVFPFADFVLRGVD